MTTDLVNATPFSGALMGLLRLNDAFASFHIPVMVSLVSLRLATPVML